MSAGEVLVYFVLLLLTPLAFMGLMVFGVVKLTDAENRRRRGEELAQQTTSDSAWEPPPEDVLLRVHVSKGMTLLGLFMSISLIGFGLVFLFLDPVTTLVLGWWSTLIGLAFLYILLKQLTITEPMVVLTTAYIEQHGLAFQTHPVGGHQEKAMSADALRKAAYQPA